MSELVTLTIDGQQVSVPAGTVIVDAAQKIGIEIPVFCYHPKMEPVGMCRMCLVEIGRPVFDRQSGEPVLEEDGSRKIQFGPKLETACTVPVSEGMVVRGMTEKVQKARKDIIEFILTSHPLDCPICDKGGECSLQDQSMAYGVGESRFLFDDKIRLGKHIPLGDLIYLDQERCIQCGRCIRFQRDLVDDPVLDFYHRGRHTDIFTDSTPPFDSYWSGNTTDICPVGALTTADFRFEARPWEMKVAPSICSHCPVGCNITYNIRRTPSSGRIEIKRVMPRQNEWVNEIWICDKGRFAHHFTVSEERLTEPLIRNGQGELEAVSWDEALQATANHLKNNPGKLVTLASGRLSNEDLFHLRHLNDGLDGQPVLYSNMAGGDLVAQVGVGKDTNLGELGPESAILVVASDLEEEAPVWWLRVKAASDRGAALIVVHPRKTKTERNADYVLRCEYGKEWETIQGILDGDTAAAKTFRAADNAVIFFGQEGLDYPASCSLAQACANLLIETGHVGKANNGLIGVWPRANTQGAWDMGFHPVPEMGSALQAADTLYIAGADPVGDGLLEDSGKAFLVVHELFMTDTARRADVVFPVKASPERSGTFTSGERRVQRFEPALPARPGFLEDFTIASKIGELLGLEMPNGSADAVLEQIARQKPDYADLTPERLANVSPQWPPIREDTYALSGTVYQNTAGLGVKLTPFAERARVSPCQIEVPGMLNGRGLLAVPITRLYDRGIMIRTSPTLLPRLLEAQLLMNPADAMERGIEDQSQVRISWKGTTLPLKVRIQQEVPVGVLLIPRSMGIPIHGPEAVEIIS